VGLTASGKDATQPLISQAAHRLARIDYVKLDVEGGEFDVLRGAAQFFARAPRRPIIQLEVNPATARAAGYTADSMLA
jgi:hypothetical protein